MASQGSHTHKATPIGEDGIVRCYEHSVKARKATSYTASNPGREFYTCCKDRDDPERCNFFYWADNPIFHAISNIKPPISPPSSPPNTPSQKQRAEQSRSPNTSGARQLKRNHSPSPSPLTPSQKRLAAIEAALKECASAAPGAQSSSAGLTPHEKRLADIQAGLSGRPISPSTPPPKPRDNDINEDIVMSTPRKNNGSQPVAGSSSSQHSLPDSESANRTPKRQRLMDSPDTQTSDHDGSQMLHTPPRSLHKTNGTSQSSQGGSFAPPESPTKGKGKEREQPNTSGQWPGIQDDPENPFRGGAAAKHNSSQQSTEGSSRAAPPPLRAAFDLTASSNEPTADSLADMLEDMAAFPAYIRKLERRRLAAEKSSDAKTRRIGELEAENQSLKTKLRVMEETISALKSRRP
ncbi:hypothetical protein PLICRDRAFT_37618 [Plicaturopsis crispa FD-325 SS-3]|nr:hypothetical protein PLICRDRAFT_37618 [Plicaturopsis crispa FD-325 SS-3]